MKITDYPSVDSLIDGDVILIDGNNGTKKLVAGGDISKMTSSFNSSDNASETGIITSAGGETSMSTMTSRDTHGGLFSGLSKAVLNIRKLINSVKALWSMIGNQWVTGDSVQVGYYRFYNGKLYRCIRAHITSNSILPTNTTYWKERKISDDLYDLNTHYTNDVIRIFKATATQNGNESKNVTIDISSAHFKKVYHAWVGSAWLCTASVVNGDSSYRNLSTSSVTVNIQQWYPVNNITTEAYVYVYGRI